MIKERGGGIVAARSRVKRVILIFAVVLAALAFGYWADWGVSGVKQPIQFPHKTHIAQKIPCTGCHQRAEKDLVAGRPPTALCLACHASGDSKSAEIDEAQSLWRQGTRNSLAAGVALALPCVFLPSSSRHGRQARLPVMPRSDGNPRSSAAAAAQNPGDGRLHRLSYEIEISCHSSD